MDTTAERYEMTQSSYIVSKSGMMYSLQQWIIVHTSDLMMMIRQSISSPYTPGFASLQNFMVQLPLYFQSHDT